METTNAKNSDEGQVNARELISKISAHNARLIELLTESRDYVAAKLDDSQKRTKAGGYDREEAYQRSLLADIDRALAVSST